MNDFYTRNELGAKLAKAVGKSSLPLNSELAFGITTADFGFSKKFGNNGCVPSIIAVTQPSDKNPRFYSGVGDDAPCALLVCDFDILNLTFMREGQLKASSTYLKLPIATNQWTNSYYSLYRIFNSGKQADDYPIKILKTKKEIDEWFDEVLPTEIEFMRTQEKELSEALKKIKTEGKPYKDIIKQYGKSSTQGREARATYENMILAVMNKLTKREAIKKSARMFEA